jgi:hypothetical protein
VIAAASFRRTLFLTSVPKGTGRFLMRRLASLIYYLFTSKKKEACLNKMHITPPAISSTLVDQMINTSECKSGFEHPSSAHSKQVILGYNVILKHQRK